MAVQKKKIPTRQCIACREMKPKSELLRVVCTKEGKIFFDGSSKHNGRGAYICRSEECVQKAQKTSALNRAFETKIDDKVFDSIIAEVKKS